LAARGCKVYSVKCLNASSHPDSKLFYEEMADLTGGVFVELNDFAVIDKMFMAICYREHSPEALAAFETEVTNEAKTRGEKMDETDARFRMFRTLSEKNLAKLKSTGRHVEQPWWDDETDEKFGPKTPQYRFNTVTQRFQRYDEITVKTAKKKKPATSTKPKKKAKTSTNKVKASTKKAKVSTKKAKVSTKKAKASTKTGKASTKSTKPKKSTPKKSSKPKPKAKTSRAKWDWSTYPYSTPEKPDWYFSGKRVQKRMNPDT